MPYSRITLRKGKPPTYLKALSESLHTALTETFDAPVKDRFQIIHQVEAEELIFDRDYLGGPRSDDYVLIAITIGRPRTAERKQAFYQRLVQLLQTSPGIRPQDVMIVINSTNAEDWSFSDGATWEAPNKVSTSSVVQKEMPNS